MVNNHKIISCIPYGRKRYVSILIKYIIHYHAQGIIDECQLLMNTDNQEDLQYAKDLSDKHSFIKLVYLPSNHNKRDAVRVKDFYPLWKDKNVVYLKIDDDVTYLDPIGLKEFLEFRIDHPEYFAVFPMIINTAATSFKLQQTNKIMKTDPPIGEYTPDMGYPEFYRGGIHTLDKVAGINGPFAEYLHSMFIDSLQVGKQNYFNIADWLLTEYENININFVAIMGEELSKITDFENNDENDFTFSKPKQLNKLCFVKGNFKVAHYAFYTQRPYLDSTDVLRRYDEISNSLLSNV